MSLRLQPVDLNAKGWQPTTLQLADEAAGLIDSGRALVTPLTALTTVDVQGTGAFDVLMRAAKIHLKEEFDALRITGKEYSTVYLGTVSAVLQTSVQFLLNQQQTNKLNADIGLVRQQTVTELANTDDNIPKGLGFNYIPAETTVIPPIDCPDYGGVL